MRIGLGSGAIRDDAMIQDYLTDVGVEPTGSLTDSLVELGISSSGITLVAVTGAPDDRVMSLANALTNRFARVILASISATPSRNPFPRMTLVSAENLIEFASRWNLEVGG